MELIPIFGIVFGNIMFMALAYFWWRVRQRKLELQADVQAKLIDKFTSTPEMVAFLQSPTGREFVNGTQIGAVAQSRERVLAGIRRAIVLIFLGIGFAALWMVFDAIGFSVPTILCFALGAGNIVATVASIMVGRRIGVTFENASRES